MESKSPEPGPGAAGRGASARREEIGGKRFRVGTGDSYVPFRSRTRRRRRIAATAVLGLLVLGAGVYGVVSLVSAPAPAPVAAHCPAGAQPGQQAQAAALPSPAQITVNVYNSTDRKGLAASTAAGLKQRGFVIGKVTNDPLKAVVSGAAQVRGGNAGTTDMRVIAAEVSGAQLMSDTRTDSSVDLVLGNGFTALTAPNQVAAMLHPTGAAAAAAVDKGCDG